METKQQMTVVDEQLKSPESMPMRVGDVQVLSTEFERDRFGHEYTVRRVHVEDESDANPEMRDMYNQQADILELSLRNNPQWGQTVIKDGKVNVPVENKAAQWLYYDEGQPTQSFEWATKFPTAIALEPLQRLEDGGRWFKLGHSDERSIALYTYMSDAIGLRSRAHIYSQRLVEYAEDSGVDELSILSLGSGAAVPNIEATRKLEASGKAVNWKFFDFDPKALMFARELIDENKFQFSTFDYGPEWINPDNGKVEPKGQFYQRAFKMEDESVDVVDALGLWEYLKPHEAIDFAKKLFEKLKPGGSLIVSNMLPSRPHREFNQRAVGWPDLHLRNETDLLNIVANAGIDTKQVTMTHAEDGVYVVMEITKS
ncbi:MAG: hypothetical protein JWO54_200 [Candidatus Saccharibacteria bacterium]|nr:hypothetical protein [Candidatus Saccharibacteria bacterium]MDB5180442.1 hypothetical protein [Candidatus Saccharibacteria bacterium]